jgi:hypothetical protein
MNRERVRVCVWVGDRELVGPLALLKHTRKSTDTESHTLRHPRCSSDMSAPTNLFMAVLKSKNDLS